MLTDNGYQITLDSDEVSPLDQNSMTDRLVFQKDNKEIKIAQVDWIADYFVYIVLKNGTKVFDIDISKIDLTKQLN